MDCMWLPALLEEPDWNKDFADYVQRLYKVFCDVYLARALNFAGIKVNYRFHPKVDGREEVFWHLTCRDYAKAQDRTPDPQRMIRIGWARALVENYDCRLDCCDSKPMHWIKRHHKSKRNRHMIFFRNYLAILEEREDYYLLITGYFVEDEYRRRDFVKEYEMFKKQKAPHKAAQSEAPSTRGS